MLRKIRLISAILFFSIITLLFLDITGSLHHWFGWMAKIQFIPALFALNVGVVVFLVVLTLLFGRVYCSVICPLGVFQDAIARVGKRGKKLPYSYSSAKSWLRYAVLAVFIIAFFVGVAPLVALLDPYASYGRIANSLFQPLWQLGNNALAYLAERVDSYAFYSSEIWIKSWITFGIAIATFALIFVLAWRNGRTYCNTICPVGTVLGFLSRFSIFRIAIDDEKCNKCSLCARNCKASCIDYKNYAVDNSRCVSCMNCLSKCNRDAIHYKFSYAKPKSVPQSAEAATQTARPIDESKRGFLSLIGLMASTSLLKAQQPFGDGGYALIVDKKAPKRATPLVPPGAQSVKHFAQHCTACQLCVSGCPNHVLRPSDNLMTLMQPEMSYERGYCRPECTACSQVCPAGAIHKISKEDKSSLQIGHAVWLKDNCIVPNDGVKCESCFTHCPVHAIGQVLLDADNPDSLKIPIVDIERCIGCGACENLCPSRPFSAIYVEGHERQKTI